MERAISETRIHYTKWFKVKKIANGYTVLYEFEEHSRMNFEPLEFSFKTFGETIEFIKEIGL